MDRAEVRRQAVRTGLYVFAILAVFTLLGSLVLSTFGITLGALQIAGGLVVAHSGFGMITSSPRLSPQESEHAATKQDVSFSPMALPLVDRLGPTGIGALTRIIGFLILAIGVELIVHGLQAVHLG